MVILVLDKSTFLSFQSLPNLNPMKYQAFKQFHHQKLNISRFRIMNYALKSIKLEPQHCLNIAYLETNQIVVRNHLGNNF